MAKQVKQEVKHEPYTLEDQVLELQEKNDELIKKYNDLVITFSNIYKEKLAMIESEPNKISSEIESLYENYTLEFLSYRKEWESGSTKLKKHITILNFTVNDFKKTCEEDF